jgi:hypothetical protein
VVLRILHMYIENREQFHELSELLGGNGLGLLERIIVRSHSWKADEDGGKAGSRFYSIRFVVGSALGGCDDPLSYSELSSGTRRIVRLLVSMIFDGSSVLLVEHPEDSIHSGLMRRLIALLAANADPAQVILASHSPEVFNGLNPEDVRLVTMVNGATEVRSLTPDEIAAAHNYMTHNGAFSEFLETVQEG